MKPLLRPDLSPASISVAVLLALSAVSLPGLCLASPSVEPARRRTAEVWVQLDLAPLATLAADDPQRETHRQRLNTQHAQVSDAIVALGGKVVGEVMITHNRIAARLPGDALQRLRQTPGVTSVQAMTHRNRIDPLPAPTK